MNRERLFQRLAQGALQNVAFRDMAKLVEGFGFRLVRVTGSHHIFAHSMLPELVIQRDIGAPPGLFFFRGMLTSKFT